jgi:hypothetical protein
MAYKEDPKKHQNGAIILPPTHERRWVAESGFQRHIGYFWGLTSPIQASSTPLHSSAAR